MELKTDILILGSGLAGVLFSLELAEKRPDLLISIISKKNIQNSSSYLAQGGIAAVLPGSEDQQDDHVKDTMQAGCYTNNLHVVEHFISLSGKAIKMLEKWGVCFDTDTSGSRDLALEGGHSKKRILHYKDYTGRYIMEILYERIADYDNIHLFDEMEGLELLRGEDQKVSGALVWNHQIKKSFAFSSKAVVLAERGVPEHLLKIRLS